MKKTSKIGALALTSLIAYDNEAGWKTDENGGVVMKDGNPVYVDSSGAEKTIGHDTISRLNAEAKGHREGKESALTELKKFEGIDPDAARKAIEAMSKIDAKQMIDSGEVDKVKSQIKSEFTKQLEEKDAANAKLQASYNDLVIGNVFNSSEFLRENLAVPSDMFQASFKEHFKVEEGQVVAYDKLGNRVISKDRVGEYATPEEALRILVESHPQKDAILKANTGSGSGSSGAGGNKGRGARISRADFEKLSPQDTAVAVAKMNKGELQLTD